MSRLLVKGLPDSFTSAQLSAAFAAQGFTPTDSKVLYSKNGTSRRMGFVGLASSDLAERAKDKMHLVWLQGGRMLVELAKEVSP